QAVPDPRVPGLARRPGRADPVGGGRQPEHDRRTRDRRTRAHAVARQREGAGGGLVPGAAGGAGTRARAVRRRGPGRTPASHLPPPGGRHPDGRDPEKYPGYGEDVKYKEGVLVGYRWYDAKGIAPAFPFGFGLSYSA